MVCRLLPGFRELVGGVKPRLAHGRSAAAIASRELLAIICRLPPANTGLMPAKCHIFCTLPTFIHPLIAPAGTVYSGPGQHS